MPSLLVPLMQSIFEPSALKLSLTTAQRQYLNRVLSSVQFHASDELGGRMSQESETYGGVEL